MHSLMGDRFLKRFLRGIHRKSKLTFNEAKTMPESGKEVISRSDFLEDEQFHGKGNAENIEKTEENSKQSQKEGGLDVTSNVTQPPDDTQTAK